MKYIFIYLYLSFVNIIDSLKPFVKKNIFLYNSKQIIKSLSGLLCKYNVFIKNEDNSETCKIIIPGYMDHEPKKEALQWYKSFSFGSYLNRLKGHSGDITNDIK